MGRHFRIVEQNNTLHDIRWLRSRPSPAGFSPEKIDAENGILRDVVMVEEGEAKGHGVRLESEFIADLVAYDQATFADRGIKARFGHPGASDNTMGMQMGFFRNVRKRKADGKMQAIADLHLLESADISPDRPNMRQWVVQMAAEAPDFLMSSIVFEAGGYYQKKANGHKVYVDNPYTASPENGDVFVEFGEKGRHYYTDLVDDGAATNSLFHQAMNPHLFVVQAEAFLDEHPALKAFIAGHPEKVLAFLNRAGAKLDAGKKSAFTMNTLLEYLFGKKEADVAPEVAQEAETLRAEFEAAKEHTQALQAERDDLLVALKKADEEIKALGAQIMSLAQSAEALKARIEALEKSPGETHTAGDAATETAALSSTKPYLNNPVYLRAQKMRRG